jgi:hypothetical protein
LLSDRATLSCTIWYMSIQVISSTIPDPARAWRALSEVRSWPDWLPTVTEVVPEDPSAPEATGAAYRVVQPRLGGARWEITDWRPGVGFTWVSRRPGVTTTGTHELVAVEGGVQAHLGIRWSGPGAWLVRAAYGGLTRRYVASEAAALVARCQGRDGE